MPEKENGLTIMASHPITEERKENGKQKSFCKNKETPLIDKWGNKNGLYWTSFITTGKYYNSISHFQVEYMWHFNQFFFICCPFGWEHFYQGSVSVFVAG